MCGYGLHKCTALEFDMTADVRVSTKQKIGLRYHTLFAHERSGTYGRELHNDET